MAASPRSSALSIVPPPPPLPAVAAQAAASSAASTTAALTLTLQQALAKGDLGKSLESMASLLSLSGDNRLKADLLLKLVDLTKHFTSLIVAAPTQTAPLLKCLRLLLIDKEPTLRSQSLRVLRYLLTDWEMAHQMLLLNIDLLLVRCLERDSKYLYERMQALKFIKAWVGMLTAAQKRATDRTEVADAKGLPQRAAIGLTRSLVQSLVSIAEQPKDDFRRVCLETIRDLALVSPGIVSSCNGIRTLVDSILDPACVDIASSLTLTLLALIDGEATRGYLRPSVDLVRLISVFTDTSAADNPERENRRAAAHKALVMLMRSWAGILVLTSDPQCLRALIGMLNLPASIKGSSWARETVFDLLFEVVHVVKAHDVRAGAARVRSSMAATSAAVTGSTPGSGVSSGACHAYPPNLLHSYMVMLLLAFLSCGLVEVLTQLALSADREFALVASKLLSEVLGLSAELLPRDVCRRLHAMRGVIDAAAAFDATDATPNIAHDGSANDGSGVAVSGRVRAVNVLSALAHGELDFLGAHANTGFGMGNAGAQAHTAPGTGWAWTGALGVNWEAVSHAAAQTAAMAAARDRRDSHDWAGGISASNMVRNGSFSAGGRGASTGDSFGGPEHTPTGRRAILHGIRLERLAVRADLFPNPARLLSSGAYGASVASNPDLLSPIASLASHSALAARNRLQHRLHIATRNAAQVAAHGGSHVSGVVVQSAAVSADFHAEEADLAPFLKRSQVLATKDFRAWEWDHVQLIIDRFMSVSPAHTAYLVAKTKFPKRLLSFLRSDKHHFVDLEWQVFHLRFVRMGVTILKAMLGCAEGREYTWFVEFVDALFLAVLWEIAATDGRKDGAPIGGTGFQALAPASSPAHAGGSDASSAYIAGRRLSHLTSGIPKVKARIFAALSRSGCSKQLMREYFVFLGILSSSIHGAAYFEKFGFVDAIAGLARDPSKDYITKLLVQNLNFWSGPMAKAWRKVLEGWLAPPTSGSSGGTVAREGCNVYLRLWTVDNLLIWWRRHHAQLASAATATEMELTGAGSLSSMPTGSVTSIVAHASRATSASVQAAQADAHECGSWVMGLLLAQLGCLDLHLRAAALSAMEEIALADPLALHALVARRPAVLRELAAMPGPAGTGAFFPAAQRLLTLFLSSRAGLEFLRATGIGGESWLDAQMAEWRHAHGGSGATRSSSTSEPSGGACTTYVRGLEDALISALSSTNKEDPDHGEEGLSVAGGSGAAHKLDELSAPPAPPSVSASAWSGPPLRSALDDHVFERVHALPWTVDLTIEAHGTRTQTSTECWVVTTSHAPPPTPTAVAATTRPPSHSDDFGTGGVTPLANNGVVVPEVVRGAPITYLVCQVLDIEGFPRPVRVEANTTLRARISVGAGASAPNVPDMLAGAGVPITPSSAASAAAAAAEARNNNAYRSSGGGFPRGHTDTSAAFQEERESDREWARTYFPDASGLASEYVCRARDRDRLSVDAPFVVTTNQTDLCSEDEARWHFEVPDPAALTTHAHTHAAMRGGVIGSSPPGVLTLESIWFPLPMPSTPVPTVALLPHLYGELARTEEGAAVLAQSGQVRELERSVLEGGISGCDRQTSVTTATVGDHTADEFITMPSASSALEKRAALWAIGHIGSTAYGFHLLSQQAPGLVAYISAQAVACPTLSMRGTCFYVLGLLARSNAGRAHLATLGWSTSPFPGGCIAIPSNISLGVAAAVGAVEADEARRAAEMDDEEVDDDESMTGSSPSRALTSPMRALALSPAPSSSLASSASPLSGFLRLEWPASSYRGSWAMDPANIYGINSSRRTRKVGGVDAGGDEKSAATSASSTPKEDANEVLTSTEGIEVILSHLSNLCNHVTQKASLTFLRAMKVQPHHAHFFTSPLLLFETYKLLACYSYKLAARRFLFFDLFSGVAFNMHTIAQFDQPFHAENVASYAKQRARATEAANAAAAAAATANNTADKPAPSQ